MKPTAPSQHSNRLHSGRSKMRPRGPCLSYSGPAFASPKASAQGRQPPSASTRVQFRTCLAGVLSLRCLALCRWPRQGRSETGGRAKGIIRGAQKREVAPDSAYDWVLQFAGVLRQLPLWTGGFGFLFVLGNRITAGASPVIAAGSALSRVDVLCLLMSAILVLTGLTWLSLAPKPPPRAELVGDDVLEVSPRLKLGTKKELLWIWQALQATTNVRSVIVFDGDVPILQAGIRRTNARKELVSPGAICGQVVESQKAVYLPNLQLYPGASEFLEYLPAKTQGVVVQPVGAHGILVAGTDTKRGVGKLDQAWISVIADKLGASLDDGT